MGIELVKRVTTNCGHLKGNEYKVLAYMAAVALDRPNAKGQPPHLYYGGWDSLAIALGKHSSANTKSSEELVRRAVQGLIRAGQIERLVEHARHGTRQCYRVTPSSPHELVGQQPLQLVGALPQQEVGSQPQETVEPRPNKRAGPRKRQEPKQDSFQDSSSFTADYLPRAADIHALWM